MKSKSFQTVAIAFALILGTASSAMAARTPVRKSAADLCPNWVKSGERGNDVYLSRMRVEYVPTLNDAVFFDAGTTRVLRGEYEARQAAEEARANAGLYDTYEEKGRFQAMKDYAHRAVDAFTRLKLKLEGDKIAKVAQNSNLPREPIAAAVLTASLYTGRSMRIRAFNNTPIDTRVVLKDRVAQATLPLASLGASATLAYNHAGEVCASSNGCAILSKSLTKNVSAELNSAERGSGRLVYSVSF